MSLILIIFPIFDFWSDDCYLGLVRWTRFPVSMSKFVDFFDKTGPLFSAEEPDTWLREDFWYSKAVVSTSSGCFGFSPSDKYLSHCSWVIEAFRKIWTDLNTSESSAKSSKWTSQQWTLPRTTIYVYQIACPASKKHRVLFIHACSNEETKVLEFTVRKVFFHLILTTKVFTESLPQVC